MKERHTRWQSVLEILERVDIVLWGRIIRRMIYYLYTHNIHDIVDLMKELEPYLAEEEGQSIAVHDNVPLPKIDADSLKLFAGNVFQVAGKHLKDEEIESQIHKWLSQEKTVFLSIISEKRGVPLAEIRDALVKFFNLSRSEIHLPPEERTNITVSLIRRFLSDNLNYIRIAKNFMDLADFHSILGRTYGSFSGQGKLGGKSAGILLAYRILEKKKERIPELEPVRLPQSWFLTSDSIIDFIHFNALEEVVSLKYMDLEEIRAGFPYLQHLFKNSFFSSDFVTQMGIVIDQIVDKPMIVRSSSLLEDSYEASFSGKYKSFFLANQGTRAQNLTALLDAIAEIYAGVFSPDPIEYRKERGLLDFREEMGILIQEVVGTRVGKYFFPTISGVALSYNEFPWSPRIGREDGVVRMVMGLGTRAVDRVGDDYPFLASPAKPQIRVNVSLENMLRYSQKKIDIINLESGRFETMETEELLREVGSLIPGIESVLSLDNGGMLSIPNPMVWDHAKTEGFVTFQGMLEKPGLFSLLHRVLNTLQENFRFPVDVEFAWNGSELHILQCRAQHTNREETEIHIPDQVLPERIVFFSRKFIPNAKLANIRFIVYVDPDYYSHLANASDMRDVATVIFKLNRLLPAKQFVLIGPGRWGSRGDIKLGVPVTYSDINNTAMLVEVAFKRGEYTPEVSFGTHFFQDLVESQIRYLPLFPEEENTKFNRELLLSADNSLELLVPEMADLQQAVRLIDIQKIIPNGRLQVRMNQSTQQAIAYLAPQE